MKKKAKTLINIKTQCSKKIKGIMFMDCKKQYNEDVNFPKLIHKFNTIPIKNHRKVYYGLFVYCKIYMKRHSPRKS